MPRFVVVEGPDLGKVFEPQTDAREISIGRAPGNTVRLNDHEISRRHVTVRPEGDGWVIQDEGSTNGTLLNGLPVRRQPLRDGDEIRVGPALLRFVHVEAGA